MLSIPASPATGIKNSSTNREPHIPPMAAELVVALTPCVV
jgi:hypothetical protein